MLLLLLLLLLLRQLRSGSKDRLSRHPNAKPMAEEVMRWAWNELQRSQEVWCIFACNQGRHRSVAAAELLGGPGGPLRTLPDVLVRVRNCQRDTWAGCRGQCRSCSAADGARQDVVVAFRNTLDV